MRTVVKTYNVYQFDELSAEAKEKVKDWYLSDPWRAEDFTSMAEEYMKTLFDGTELKVQYSLSYCQGDGLNIYGTVSARDVWNCLQQHRGGEELAQFEDRLTEKEWKRILHYADECGDITLPYNRRYSYCLAEKIDIAGAWYDQLGLYSGYANINEETLKKFERLVIDIFSALCKEWEDLGYEYFYNILDADLADACNANYWEFLSDGTFYGGLAKSY